VKSAIKGRTQQQVYICCQAPLPNTFEDFWRMIWEQKCPVIVMLTRFVEKKIVKADMYWPETSQQYGRIFVQKRSECNRVPSIFTRHFIITNSKEPNIERKVVQLHYTDWPDQGVPETTEAMTELINELDLYKRGLQDPITVHCSAGIGRTGTFLAIHMALQMVLASSEKLEEINVMDLVFNLRRQRAGMVQSKDQYKFVYATIQDILVEKCILQRKNVNEQILGRSMFFPKILKQEQLMRSAQNLSLPDSESDISDSKKSEDLEDEEPDVETE